MRRRKKDDEDSAVALLVGAAGAMWRCRLELLLLSVLVLVQVLLAGLVGIVPAACWRRPSWPRG